MLLLLLAALGLAYETDQLTDRGAPLEDARPLANAHLNELLADAIARTNRKTRCRADNVRTHKVLARKITHRTARPAWVLKRGLTRAPGFTTYSAWLEREDAIDKRAWRKRDDVFGDITFWESFILRTAGPSSTIAVGGEIVGTDKLDHFLNFGFISWRKTRMGAKPEKAKAFSIRTERSFFGLITSKTYSYGDIEANGDGYTWYRDLLTPDGGFARDGDGCVVQTEAFDWGVWVDWRYDEALNPPMFTPLVQHRVTRKITRERDRYCAAWEALGGPDYDDHLRRVISEDAIPLPKRFDRRFDPWGLTELCHGLPEHEPPPLEESEELGAAGGGSSE